MKAEDSLFILHPSSLILSLARPIPANNFSPIRNSNDIRQCHHPSAPSLKTLSNRTRQPKMQRFIS